MQSSDASITATCSAPAAPPPARVDPTPEEIARYCRELQQSWSPNERKRREGYKPVPWLLPVCPDHVAMNGPHVRG